MEKPVMYLHIIVYCLLSHTASGITNYYMADHCGGSIDVGFSNQIRVRLSRSSSFSHSNPCQLLLSTYTNSRLMVYYKGINIYDSTAFCSNSFLEIHDGNTRSGPCLTGSCRQCGLSPPGGVYQTTGDYMFLNYQSQTSFSSDSFDLVITSYHTGYCYSYEHQCDNGRCIAGSLTCNGYNSCGDHSDCHLDLSVGGIAGVVIGCGTFITLVVIVIIVCRRRRRTIIVKESVPVVAPVSSYGYNQPVPTQYPPPAYPGTQQGQYQNY